MKLIFYSHDYDFQQSFTCFCKLVMLYCFAAANRTAILFPFSSFRYIENLDKPFISNWEKHLMATQENTGSINDSGRLPVQWLASGAGSHGTVVNALWALREYMMKDSLGIAKIL